MDWQEGEKEKGKCFWLNFHKYKPHKNLYGLLVVDDKLMVG